MQFFLAKALYKTYNEHNRFAQYEPSMAPFYPLTGGMHIGSDYKVPVGTPIYAPAKGKMFTPIMSGPKGNVGIYSFNDPSGKNYGIEFCHLRFPVKAGNYNEGDIIGYTGATGTACVGPHLHTVQHLNTLVTANLNEISAANYNTNGSLAERQTAARNKVLQMLDAGKLVDTYKYFAPYI